MDSGHCKAGKNVEGDRLSMLPDDLIYKILSLINIKYAVRTSSLSSRWRFIWPSMPYLNISTDDSQFVNHLLSRRNNQKEVYSVKLKFHERFNVLVLKRILEYAFSHNVQQLNITYLVNEMIDFPLYLFCSESLKDLRLRGSTISFFEPYSIVLASTWELPALTTLHLDNVTFCEDNDGKGIGLFSKCANLKNLIISHFSLNEMPSFTVSHPRISNLVLEDGFLTLGIVNVVAPQLENLTIRGCHSKHVITTPNLVSLVSSGRDSRVTLEFTTDLHSLEKVDLCFSSWCKWSYCRRLRLLQQLRNAKFLTLNLEFLEPLNSYVERMSLQPSPFLNLRSLKIYPEYVPLEHQAHKKVILSTEVMSYLLDGSPSVIFTLVSYEEVAEKERKARAFRNAVAAQQRMTGLQKMLELEKANIVRVRNERKKTPMKADREDDDDDDDDDNEEEEGKTQVVEKMHVRFKRKMTEMKRWCEDVGVQIVQGRRNAGFILSQLRGIEKVMLEELPPSKTKELQACYSRLCAEVETVVKQILHNIKIPHIHLNDCFNELDTASLQPSSC